MNIWPLVILSIISSVASAQSTNPLPVRVKTLQDGYNAAVERAAAPITATYVKELERLKIEYTKAGDLDAAISVDEILKKVSPPANGQQLAVMNLRDFQKWLSSVKITEIGGPYGIQYTYKNGVIITSRTDREESRTHPTATIEVGKLLVPFTSTIANITINRNLTEAEVVYTTGGTYKATISKR